MGATSPRGKRTRTPHSNLSVEVRIRVRVGNVVLELDLVLGEEPFAGNE